MVSGKDRIELMNKSPQYFERLVLVCIDSYDSEKRHILQHFSRSIRFAFLCTAQISNFQQKLRENVLHFFRKFSRNFQNFVIFQQNFDKFCPEFHETLRKFMRKQRKILRKCWFAENLLIFAKFAAISGIGEKVHSFISSVQSYPYSASFENVSWGVQSRSGPDAGDRGGDNSANVLSPTCFDHNSSKSTNLN